ncbi:hypothetical protein JRQ81_010359 [Phrynocephalus forsythii]|uniref:G-protein coupled receptors family 1 profile domain-containing protein n=1 Tax=Phrynocephalus forsythii TaxID=171643 RepID=A0A9Q0X8Z2_9SAUR|nr:hypothetical protein JRQ81_010359 [Phrynocephalus forsythii]
MENISVPSFWANATVSPENANPPYTSLQTSMHLLSIVIYGAACLLGVTGNGLVLWIAGFKMKKTVNVVWFLNLAAADFVFTLLLPLSIVYTALGFHWPFGRLLCKLNSTVAFLNMFASVFLLTVISMDRNVTSCYNNFALSDRYDAEETRRVWRARHKAMVVTRFVFGFALPFTVIVLCHSVIAVRMKSRRLTKSSKPFRIIVAVTVCFFLCYFPYHVFSLLEMSKMSADHNLKTVLYLGIPLASSLAFFNSCVNPILYVFVGQKKFRKSVVSAFEGAFGEDLILSLSKRKSRSISQMEIQMA